MLITGTEAAHTCSVTLWLVSRSWSPSGRISGSTIGTRPFCHKQAWTI